MAAVLADLHREDFIRPWTDGEFAAAARPRTRCSASPPARPATARHAPVGFVLARLAAGEAEILTVAVARSASPRAGSAGG